MQLLLSQNATVLEKYCFVSVLIKSTLARRSRVRSSVLKLVTSLKLEMLHNNL